MRVATVSYLHRGKRESTVLTRRLACATKNMVAGGNSLTREQSLYESDGTMFIDKLWVRIKGELLTLKEDLSVTEDLRTKAGRLLDHVQERVIGGYPDPTRTDHEDEDLPRAGREEISKRPRRDLADIEQEWQQIAKERDRQKGSDQEPKSPPPNPRRLG